jgi:hypothetical protein
MKKLNLFAFLLIVSMVVSVVSPRVVAETAKDCLPIPDNVKTVVVSKDDVALRTSSQKVNGAQSNITATVKSNESLEIFNHKPTFKDKYCWYEVKTPKERTNANQESLWVAKENLLPFDSTVTTSPSPEVSPANKATQGLKPSPSITPSTQQSPNKVIKPNQQIQRSKGWSKWLQTILTWVGVIGFVVGLPTFVYVFFKLREEFNILKQQITSNHLDMNSRFLKFDNLDAKIQKLELEKQTDDRHIREIYKTLENVQADNRLLRSQINQQNQFKPEIKTETTLLSASISPQINSSYSLFASKEIDIVILKFNSQDKLYFNDPRFHPVKLTKESIQGLVGIDGRRTIRFEPAEPSQGTYLEFSLDSKNWLIPNITSPYYNQILNQVSANPEIFAINLGSGNNQLVKAAKLKSVSGGVWEIAEPGEFQ